MNLFRSTAVVLALTTGMLALPAHAEVVEQNSTADPIYNVEAPKAYSMIGDLIIARPLLIGATVIGAAAFIVSLPFTALGGNVKEAGQALVVEPGREAFVRCLGCSSSQQNPR
ncbi:multidrug transporter [Pseudomonas oligotrophica]|uniref:multidrug transporter n=1 Tax=Pseudomonas oligotrophica TaxID=2912055 RepID=UPI001F35D0C4|nr:multidrug transporter [Pseudomonas oligotrophica]MCF7200949.1 multidrug transporter [Pseudomonas oligotrophica]